jgi:DNA helicase-2/ATP-dependent DNA helicase PcrA
LDIKINDLQKITYNAKRKSLPYFEILKNARVYSFSPESLEKIDKLVTLVNEGSEDAKIKKPSQILFNFLEKSGYLEYLQKEVNNEKLQKIHYLTQFLEKMCQYESVSLHKSNLLGFLEVFEYGMESGDEGDVEQPITTSDCVQIMTVHASKGLEFKYVYLINLVEDRFPSRKHKDGIEIPEELVKEKAPTGDAHYQEERRLFYVALTRAKKSTYLYSADNYGGVREKKISRFLSEIGFVGNTDFEKELTKKTLKSTSEKIADSSRLEQFEVPKKFSFSQLASYESCPYQYKLAHVIKIPTRGNASLSFGQTMHSTMQKFYTRVQELNKVKQSSLFTLQKEAGAEKGSGVKYPSLENLIDLYNQSWIDDWYQNSEQKKTYYEQGKDILKKFYEKNFPNFDIPISLEGWFKVSIEGNILHGRIDRIDQLPDGTLEIIDYKTGRPKTKLESSDKDQLLLYQIATEELPQFHHIGKTSKLTFYYLNDGTMISFLGTQKEIEKFKSKTALIIEKISSHSFEPTPSQYVCGSCAFKEICEFRQL